MRFTVKGRIVRVETEPVILSSLILGWAIYYYFSTLLQPDVGPQSVLFIKPLVLIISISYIFVLFSCLKISAASDTATDSEAKKETSKAFKRFIFVLSLAVYAAAITYFGYLLPSILFMLFVCYYLGMRRPWLLAILALGIPSFLSVVFKLIIGVPLPIFPSWELFL